MKHALRPLAAVAVLLTLAIIACGGNDEDADPTTTSTSGGVTISGAGPPAGPTDLPTPASATGGSDTAGGDEFDACALLLPEDVEPLIGSAPEPTEEAVGPFATCSYWDTSAAFAQFQVCRCLPGEELDTSLEAGASALGVELKEVGGAGERAFWLEGILWVQQGDVVFNVWISRPAYFQPDGTALTGQDLEVAALSDAQMLAQTIAARLE